MARNEVPMTAGDSLPIRFRMTEDGVTVPLDGYALTLTVATTPTPSVATAAGVGDTTKVTIPAGIITTAGMYRAQIVAAKGIDQFTLAFRVRVDARL